MEQLNFLTKDQLKTIKTKFTLPVFAYSEEKIKKTAKECLAFPNSYWLTVRFAMKANPNQNILKIFHDLGLKIDASSGYEVERAIKIWIPAKDILLTAQELPHNFVDLIKSGVEFNACSLHQLEEYGKNFPSTKISIRLNPGLWSGESNRVNVWWPASSFGIRYKHISDLQEITKKYNLTVHRMHSHIGCGTNPDVRENVAVINLQLLKNFPDVKILNLWWWFKVWRMIHEKTANLQRIWENIKLKLEEFYQETWRKIHLEIEPWTYLMANNWSLITEIQDIADTWRGGYKFLKVNGWMTEVTRPSMYGSQHPLIVVNDATETDYYLVVWHCCESGDMRTCKESDPEWLKPRILNKANIWDLLVMEWVWAYCSWMSVKNYNSFPEAGELLIRKNNEIVEIRKKQKLEQIRQNEIEIIYWNI